MNWLTNFVRPKIQSIIGQKSETPDNLWHKCKGCGQLLYVSDFEKNLNICHNCDHHERIGPTERFKNLFNNGEYSLVELPKPHDDPLKFKDQKKYTERLKAARSKSEYQDAIAVAYGKMGNVSTVIAVQNFLFMGGSMGVGVGDGPDCGSLILKSSDALRP